MTHQTPTILNSRLDKSQRGMASIIFVTLVSLAITASSIGVMHSIKSSQQINTASNAVTHSQNGMWLGAEAFRQYLFTFSNATAVDGLRNTTGVSIELSDTTIGTLTANDIFVQPAPAPAAPDTLEVSATIVNEHLASKSSSAIRVVYQYVPPAPSASAPPATLTMNFDGDLILTGGLDLTDGGDPIDFKVGGDVTVDNISVNAIGNIEATGSVTLGSQVEVESIYANDDVLLTGAAKAGTIQTLGTLTTIGGAKVTNGFANDDILIDASKQAEILRSRKNVTIKRSQGHSKPHGYVDAGETITIAQGPVNTVAAVGDVNITNWTNVGDVVTGTNETTGIKGNISCPSKWWYGFDSLSANGTLHHAKCPSDVPAWVPGPPALESGASNVVTPMAELEAFIHEPANLDVWTLRDSANYIVEYDSTLNKIKVTVQQVNGIAPMAYYLGDYAPPYTDHRDYLCTAFDAAGKCLAPTAPLAPICIGESVNNQCISYDEATEKFTFIAVNTAPGVMFFDGNLHLQNGHGMSTFIASGDITTAGAFETWAPNFGGYSKVCLGNSDHVRFEIQTRYETEFSDHYPTNYCDTTSGTYTSQPIANIALAAGGFNPSEPATYAGGNITLGSSSVVVGAVMAGNYLTTGGDVEIQGIINASADGEAFGDTGSNVFSGSTTIDIQGDGADYNPTDLPIEDGEYSMAEHNGEPLVVLQWSRSL